MSTTFACDMKDGDKFTFNQRDFRVESVSDSYSGRIFIDTDHGAVVVMNLHQQVTLNETGRQGKAASLVGMV